MEVLKEVLKDRAQSATALLQEGITKTEQKLEQCLHVLASVQEEVRQQQEEQAEAIQQEYNRQLQQLTDGFEQQVLHLQQQTIAQLEDLQAASEDALQSAAGALLQELQLPHAEQLAVLSSSRLSTSPAGNSATDMCPELSLTALQLVEKIPMAHLQQAFEHHHQRQQQRSWPKQDRLQLQHESAVGLHGIHDAAAAHVAADDTAACGDEQHQHELPKPGNPVAEAPDTEEVFLQDQLSPQQEPEQLPSRQAAAASAGEAQHPSGLQWQQQEGQCNSQPQHASPSTPAASACTLSSAPSPPASMGKVWGRGGAYDWDRISCSSPGSAKSDSSLMPAQTGVQVPAGHQHWGSGDWGSERSPADRRGIAEVWAAPCHSPWQALSASCAPTSRRCTADSVPHRQQQQQQQAPAAGLRGLSALPARRHTAGAVAVSSGLRKCVSHVEPLQGAAVLRRASSLRRQLQSDWQQGLAKAACRAASAASARLQGHDSDGSSEEDRRMQQQPQGSSSPHRRNSHLQMQMPSSRLRAGRLVGSKALDLLD